MRMNQKKENNLNWFALIQYIFPIVMISIAIIIMTFWMVRTNERIDGLHTRLYMLIEDLTVKHWSWSIEESKKDNKNE